MTDERMSSSPAAKFVTKYPKYVVITENYPKGPVVLALLHDENHPEAIAIFPIEQLKTAEYVGDFLNKDNPIGV